MIFLLCLSAVLCSANALPSGWQTCKKSSPDFNTCIKNDIHSALVSLKDGNKALEIEPLDPYFIPMTVVEVVPGLDFTITNSTTHGLTLYKIDRLELDDWKTLKMWLHCDKMSYDFMYITAGRIFNIDVSSSGDAHVDLEGVHTEMNVTFSEYKKNDKTHLKVEDIHVHIHPDKVESTFDPHNKDKAFAKIMNQVINSNWRSLWVTSEGGADKWLGQIVRHIIDHVFEKIPKEEIDFP